MACWPTDSPDWPFPVELNDAEPERRNNGPESASSLPSQCPDVSGSAMEALCRRGTESTDSTPTLSNDRRARDASLSSPGPTLDLRPLVLPAAEARANPTPPSSLGWAPMATAASAASADRDGDADLSDGSAGRNKTLPASATGSVGGDARIALA